MIQGERIRLRAIERADLPMIAAWRNEPDVYRCFFEYEPLSLAKQQRWFESFLARDDEKYWIAETIDDSEPATPDPPPGGAPARGGTQQQPIPSSASIPACEGNRPWRAVGTIALCDIDLRSRKAELGRVLIYPEKHRGQGYSSEMCTLTLNYAFDHLNLNRVWLRVFTDNAAALAVYRKLGFQQEGVLREHTFAGGAFRDVAVLSLLRSERRSAGCSSRRDRTQAEHGGCA